MKNFKEGMITRVSTENFLTYDKANFFPGAKLNMIVGPNGTGKSSIVNAIVLGLAGKTQVIGRAKQLGAFVKNGCERARVEVELYHEPNNYVIGRSFNTQNQNSWTINGRPATIRQVEEVIKKFNIQIDNLCQFLPQDKVQDFAKMDSKQLLENTLKTVGSAELIENHIRLRQLREKDVNFGNQTLTVQQQLESEKKKLASLEVEVKVEKEREEVLRSIKNVEKKKGWMEYKVKETKKQEVLSDREKILNMKTEAETKVAPFEREIKKTREEIKNINGIINRELRVSGDTASSIKTKFNAVANVEDNIQSLQTELEHKLDRQKRKAHKISSLESEIRTQTALVDPNKENELSQEIFSLTPKFEKERSSLQRVKEYIEGSSDKVGEFNRQKNRLQSAIEREQSASNQKLQLLNQRFPDTFKAYQWLQQNRDQFEGDVYGPLMLEVNCSKELAKYVEFVIPTRELIMFVCEKATDATKMMKTVRDQMKLRINVAQASKNPNRPPRQNYPVSTPIENLRQFGFSTYILEEIQGVNLVLNYLCHNFAIHQIPVGNDKTNRMVEKIPPNINYYFSDTKNFMVRTSKFSGEKSSRIVEVRNSTFLGSSVNTALIASCEAELQQVTAQLSKEVQNLDTFKNQLGLLEREMNNLQTQKRDLNNELMQLKTKRTKLKMMNDELEALIRDNDIDPEEETEATNRKIRKLVTDMSKEQRKIIGHVRGYQDGLVKLQLHKLKQSAANQILREKEEAAEEETKRLEDLKRMLTNVEEQLREVQREMKRALAEAQRLTEGLSLGYPDFNKKYGDIFDALPNDLEALDIEIFNLTARADCLAGGRAHIIEEYEKAKKIISRLESEFGSSDQRLQNLKGEMEALRNVWIPQVNALIERINNNFTKYFKVMKCVGEVSLEEPPNKDDYAKYGICIKVQFRDSGRLQQLDTHTQSGGERAVSTAIYMLSLQELTTVPFRCVDEINQGMDENNERTVFKLIVSTMEDSDSAQCFLLTPKFLTNLQFSPYVDVHCIMAGGQPITDPSLYLVKRYTKEDVTSEPAQASHNREALTERNTQGRKRSYEEVLDSE